MKSIIIMGQSNLCDYKMTLMMKCLLVDSRNTESKKKKIIKILMLNK